MWWQYLEFTEALSVLPGHSTAVSSKWIQAFCRLLHIRQCRSSCKVRLLLGCSWMCKYFADIVFFTPSGRLPEIQQMISRLIIIYTPKSFWLYYCCIMWNLGLAQLHITPGSASMLAIKKKHQVVMLILMHLLLSIFSASIVFYSLACGIKALMTIII